jgi:hypothetical protein
MQETNNMQAPVELAEGFNPFSDEQQIKKVEEAPANNTIVEDAIANESTPTIDQTESQTQQPEQSTFDPNSFIKERFGFDTVDEAEQEFRRLIEEREQAPSFDFSDDISRTLFDAIREGKTDDVYNILAEQKRLEKLTTAEVTPDLAFDIIKTNIQNKYQDLTPEEVDLLFYESYNFPPKPEQGYEETDEEYKEKLQNWESQVNFIEKRMVIDAKVIRPELNKLKSDLQLPDIYGLGEYEARLQEESEVLSQARTSYERALDSQFNSFSGFNVSVKDEEVEIPITFNVADEERLALKQELSDFDGEAYLENRWFNEAGEPNVKQIMADKYVLENLPRILQKVANEAASQRLLAHLKKTGNITLNQQTPQGAVQQSPNADMDRLAAWAFSS